MAKKENKKKKGFILWLMETLDKKMKEKAKKTSCCGSGTKKNGPSCC